MPRRARPEPDPGWAVFLDFDGTLVEIAERPDAIAVPPGLPGRLAALRDRCGGALALVTGRALADLDGFLPGLRPDGAGLHGLERRAGGEISRLSGLKDLGHEVEALRQRLAPYPGLLVEDKGVSIGIHWRLAPEHRPVAEAAADDLLARLGPGYRAQTGKAVREILDVRAGKGAAILALLAAAPFRGRRPLFVGDDVTDEHGFAAVNEVGGLSVKVGPGETGAARRIANVRSLLIWLDGPLDPEALTPA